MLLTLTRKIDVKEALRSPGVIKFISAVDIPGENLCSSDKHELFASSLIPAHSKFKF